MFYTVSSILKIFRTGTMNKYIVFLAALGIVGAATTPNNFDKCKKNDPELTNCLTKNFNKGWPKVAEEYNLKKIPIKDIKADFPNVLRGVAYEGYFLGYDNIVFDKVKIDFKKQKFEAIYSQPLLITHADKYKIFVDFLGLNLYDTGAGNCTFTDNIFRYSFDYDIVERNGEEFMQLKNPIMTYNTKKLTFDIYSLENKERGIQIKNVFNNFWRIFNILGESALGNFIGVGVQPVIEKYLSSVPMNSMFA